MQLIAEFLGTFILIFGATAAPIVNQKYNGVEGLFGNALCAGLAVMIVILSTGHLSGAHLNPSLTIAFAVFRHFPWAHVPAYIVAQVSASICASFALKGVYNPFLSGGVTVPSVPLVQAFFTEFIIAFILLFVVTAVATDTKAVSFIFISFFSISCSIPLVVICYRFFTLISLPLFLIFSIPLSYYLSYFLCLEPSLVFYTLVCILVSLSSFSLFSMFYPLSLSLSIPSWLPFSLSLSLPSSFMLIIFSIILYSAISQFPFIMFSLLFSLTRTASFLSWFLSHPFLHVLCSLFLISLSLSSCLSFSLFPSCSIFLNSFILIHFL